MPAMANYYLKIRLQNRHDRWRGCSDHIIEWEDLVNQVPSIAHWLLGKGWNLHKKIR